VTPAKPRNCSEVRVYSLSDLEAIALRYKGGVSLWGPYRDAEERVWLRSAEIVERYEVHPTWAWDRRSKNGSLTQCENALRWKRIPNPDKGSASKVYAFLQEDVERLLQQEKTKNAAPEKPALPPETFEDRERRALKFLREFLADGPRCSPEVRQAARRERIGRNRLHRVANKLRVSLKGRRFRHLPLWWCLPGQQPPSHPGGDARSETAEPSASLDDSRQPSGLETAFNPSPLQKAILKVLDGRAKTADDLQFSLRVDRRRLYYGGTPDGKGGLSELCDRGSVQSGKGKGIRGYYRPDRPPPSRF